MQGLPHLLDVFHDTWEGNGHTSTLWRHPQGSGRSVGAGDQGPPKRTRRIPTLDGQGGGLYLHGSRTETSRRWPDGRPGPPAPLPAVAPPLASAAASPGANTSTGKCSAGAGTLLQLSTEEQGTGNRNSPPTQWWGAGGGWQQPQLSLVTRWT